MKATILYNRVSCKDQKPELQVQDCEALARSLGFYEWDVLEEKASAYKDNVKRPVFDSITKEAQEGKIKVLIVWDFDRLFRNRIKTVEFIRNYTKLGLKVYSVRQQWFQDIERIPPPFNDMVKDLMLQVVGWIAEEESIKKSERVKLAVRKEEGITKSYKGNKWGRKVLPKKAREDILELHKQGQSIRQITKQVSYYDHNNNKRQVSIASVHKTITKNTPEITS